MGSRDGAEKSAATKLGLTVEEWRVRRGQGQLWCRSCRQWLRDVAFTRDASRGSGRATLCRKCNSAASTASRYGLTPAELREMHAAQGGACAICRRRGQKLEVDHCHASGSVRALLCSRCNGGLGLFLDSPGLLSRAINYLESHRG